MLEKCTHAPWLTMSLCINKTTIIWTYHKFKMHLIYLTYKTYLMASRYMKRYSKSLISSLGNIIYFTVLGSYPPGHMVELGTVVHCYCPASWQHHIAHHKLRKISKFDILSMAFTACVSLSCHISKNFKLNHCKMETICIYTCMRKTGVYFKQYVKIN